MAPIRTLLGAGSLLALAACQQTVDPGVTRLSEPPEADVQATEGVGEGVARVCWHSAMSPAVIETVTEQVVLKPAVKDAEGAVIEPPVYRTETRQEIVQERRETRYETPCPEVMTEEFIASLQRALQVRRLYWGPITGRMNSLTKRAIRTYQTKGGLESAVLSTASAQELGLIAYSRESFSEG